MEYFAGSNKDELLRLEKELELQLKRYKDMSLDLNMARGKPCKEQLDLCDGILHNKIDFTIGPDYRNYGILDGIPELKSIFKDIMEVEEDQIIIGGNSSLTLMYDSLMKAMLLGTLDSEVPWSKQDVSFLCPVPGYDRHFSICEALGIKMINIPLNDDGPDMDLVEALVAKDESIKGMWCVPKYSNPTGITYSDEVVTRLASMTTKAKDFRIMWDNAYAVHHLTDDGDQLLNIMDVCKEYGTDNRVYMFTSTSKITFPGAGIACMAGSKANMDFMRQQMSIQTIGSNKINQLMHARFLPDIEAIKVHMNKHALILKPKFDLVEKMLKQGLDGLNIAAWNKSNGGYFVSLDILDGCAKDVVKMCKDLGVTLTGAGATFPYKHDPKDANIRLAPTFPPMEELETAIEVLLICIKYVCVRKVLEDM